jgi:hypothetical protein
MAVYSLTGSASSHFRLIKIPGGLDEAGAMPEKMPGNKSIDGSNTRKHWSLRQSAFSNPTIETHRRHPWQLQQSQSQR